MTIASRRPARATRISLVTLAVLLTLASAPLFFLPILLPLLCAVVVYLIVAVATTQSERALWLSLLVYDLGAAAIVVSMFVFTRGAP